MREIKFRAWDGKNKRMCFAETDSPLFDSEGMFPEEIINTSHRINGWEWMQFVGLQDKNEKDIYEGDIVKTLYGMTLVVCWDYDGYGLFDKVQGIGVREDSLSDECEILGNIYENPELIK